MFQPEGSHEGLAGNTSMFSPPQPPPTGSGRKKTTKAKNQPRERLPEPGEALLENLHNILNDLKGSKKSGLFIISALCSRESCLSGEMKF